MGFGKLPKADFHGFVLILSPSTFSGQWIDQSDSFTMVCDHVCITATGMGVLGTPK